jgi:hypothetical protein
MDLHAIPQEILQDILEHFSGHYSQLRNCSLVCRALTDTANALLYRHINLQLEYDDEHEVKSKDRQRRLITSLAGYA